MNSEEKKHIRAIVRRVHPDLFAAQPFERARNSESLKVIFKRAQQRCGAHQDWMPARAGLPRWRAVSGPTHQAGKVLAETVQRLFGPFFIVSVLFRHPLGG